MTFYSQNIQHAIHLASVTHEGQTRKSSGLPYIIHPLTVATILARTGASEDVVVAGVLHDTVEDSDGRVTLDAIAEQFGAYVSKLVGEVTEQDKSLPWDVRKQQALDHIPQMSQDALLLKSADVLANTADMAEMVASGSDEVWQKFNGTKEQTLHNRQKVVEALARAWPENPLLPELHDHLNRLTATLRV